MDLTIINKRRRGSVIYCDVASLQQKGSQITVECHDGWKTRFRVPDESKVIVTLEWEDRA